MTKAMNALLLELDATPLVKLPSELRRIANSPFIRMYDCVLLDAMLPSQWRHEHGEKSKFTDLPTPLRLYNTNRTLLERFISKIAIEENIGKRQLERNLSRDLVHLQYSWAFLNEIFKSFRSQFKDNVLRGLIGMNNGCEPDHIYSCHVYYHVKREHEYWAPDDFIEWDVPFLEIDSDEPPLLSREVPDQCV